MLKRPRGLLLFIDFEKAFDSLEWDLIAKALNVFNFGPNVKRWISIFYNGVQSAVINGGFLTNYFQYIKRSSSRLPAKSSLIYPCGGTASDKDTPRTKLQRR